MNARKMAEYEIEQLHGEVGSRSYNFIEAWVHKLYIDSTSYDNVYMLLLESMHVCSPASIQLQLQSNKAFTATHEVDIRNLSR